MRKLFLMLPFIVGVLVYTSCSTDDDDFTTDTTTGSGTSDNDDSSDTSSDFTTNTQDVTVQNAVLIEFGTNDTINVTNPYSDVVSVTTEGGSVVITSTVASTELNYVLSGQTTSGSVKIYSDYKFGLVLNGVSITSQSGPAINIQSSKKVSLSVIDKTNNRLIDGTTYPSSSTEDMKAALFSEGQLVFSGTGNLTVYGKYKHAIASDDYIRINEGNIQIASAVKDGIHVNDYFEMNGGTLNIVSSGDGIECEGGYVVVNAGTLTLNSSGGDGIKTSYTGADTSITPYIDIVGGSVNITVSGQAAKGIKSKGDINLSGGTVNIKTTGNAYYDTTDADVSSSAGIKSTGNTSISGSNITINSSGSGGKGINVDGTLTFDGGITSVTTTGDQFVYDSNNDTAAKAIKSDGALVVNSGTIYIKTSKTEAEGLESKSTITINGGLIEIEAYDDGINAATHIEITGGTVYSISQTNDAIDSNGTMTISGGTVIAIGSSAPETGFDCDNNTFKITGGTVIGIGGSTSTPTSSVSTQRSLVYGGSSFDIVHIESANGDELVTFKSPKTLSQTVLLFSSPNMNASTSYTIYTGGSISGGTSSYGLYTGASYIAGTSAGTFTPSSMVTTVGSTGNAGGGPNGGGGGRP